MPSASSKIAPNATNPGTLKTEKTDEDLIHAARKGDQHAFKQLVERHEARVATTVMAMLGRTAEAEDVGQETFIRFYKALDTFRGESSLSTYLNRIAINLSLNALKRRKRFFSRFEQTDEQNLADIKGTATTESAGFENTETGHLIQQAILKLKPAFRAVIVLRLVEGYSTRETAEILNLPIGTVLSRLSRAQLKLRDLLRPYFSDENK